MATSPATCSAQEKRACLEAVLSSRSFERSDQLKRFLRYICEQELAGRGEEVTEYSIGVEALGRPADFSPNDDSCVRNRAFALRKKLEEFYHQEAPDSPLRIELPKGSYLPRFVSSAPCPEPVVEAAPEIAPVAENVPPARRSLSLGMICVALLLGLLLGAFGMGLRQRDRLLPEPAPALQAAWGGMLHPGAHVLVSVATPPQAYMREFPDSAPRAGGYHPVDPEIREWYLRQRREQKMDGLLLQVPTFNSPLWGDAAGSFRVARMLQRYGAEPELLAERLVAPAVFRNRNVVLLGNPEYSPTIKELLRNLPLQLGYDPATKDHGVSEVDPSGTVIRRFAPKRDGDAGSLLEVFGLITSMPSQGDGEQHTRYLVISGISSAGTEAAAEYLTGPSHMEDLARRMGLKSGDPWPARLQVLIRASTNRTMALSFAYETHRVVN